MKQRVVLSLVIASIVASMGLAGCGNSTEAPVSTQPAEVSVAEPEEAAETSLVDEQQALFLKSLQEGLEARWNIESNTDTIQAEKDSAEEKVKAEYDAISSYADVEFKDAGFSEVAKGYIAAVQSQYDAMEYFFDDNTTYNELYYINGLQKRCEYMNQLVENYGFSVGSDYKDELKDLTNTSENQSFKRIDFEETTDATCDYGDLSISIDNVKVVETSDNEFLDIAEGTKIIAIEATIKNISYEDEYNPGFISAENFMGVMTEDGITAPAWEYGDQYDGYDTAAGAFFDCAIDSKVRVALPFIVDEDDEMVEIYMLPGTTMIAPIEE